MKNSKKLIALVLAMVMIFALTASALAATNATGVTVRVTIKGVINKPTGTDPNATETETLCTAKHRLTRAHREKQLKMSCQALHNAPPNRT